VETNQLRQKERMEIGRQNLTADEAIFQFEQQRAEAEARKKARRSPSPRRASRTRRSG
jgi:hypothetical protein